MLISPTAAAAEAKRGLEVFRFDDPAAAAARLSGHAGTPLLVERLDMPQRDYYLVPWQDYRGIVIIVQVDAWNGKMSSLAVLPVPSKRLMMTPQEARRSVETKLAEAVLGEPRLVWQPSRESASPLQPLYHVRTASGDVFVSSEDSIYRSLTPFGRGG